MNRPLDGHEDRLETARQALAELGPGLHYFVFHPCRDTPELRDMAPDWRCRVADYELFRNDAWRRTIEQSGVKVIGFRALRDLLR